MRERFTREFASFPGDELLQDEVPHEAGEKEGVKREDEQIETSRKVLTAMLKGLLERDLYENGAYIRAVNGLDPVFNEALRIITSPEEYNRLLNPAK